MESGERSKSIRNIINDVRPVIRKSIVIGIGDSGVQCVLSAKKMMEKNIPAGARRYVSWIGIDMTDPRNLLCSSPENSIHYIPAPLPAEITPGSLSDMRRNDSVFSWLPDPEDHVMPVSAGNDACRLRPVGRLAFFNNRKSIREAIISERDRLAALPEDHGRLRILDIEGAGEKKRDTITFTPESGVTRYYFSGRIPPDHVITGIEPDQAALSLLFPDTVVRPDISAFPCDEMGCYFDLSSDHQGTGSLSFDVTHIRSGAKISVFIIASAACGTGSGMFLDVAAAVRDIFKGYRNSPLIYGAILLPSSERGALSTIGSANAYAALKEIDFFMSGTPFRAEYPGGHRVEITGRIFDDGMLYLFDAENMAGTSLHNSEQVHELAGEFITTFISSPAAGPIRERILSDSPGSSVFYPADEKFQRRGSYNSFGISRGVYPAEELREIGYRLISIRIIDSLLKDTDSKDLIETLGDKDSGLVRKLGLSSTGIFERVYPEYKVDPGAEIRPHRRLFDETGEGGEPDGYITLMEKLKGYYSGEGIDYRRAALITGMERRYRIDLERIRTLLSSEIRSYIKDPGKGFIFAGRIIDLIIAKTETYRKKYYSERTSLEMYSSAEMEKLITEGGEVSSRELADAVLQMSAFNYSQLVYGSMLISAGEFLYELRNLLFKIKNDEINSIICGMTTLRGILKHEVEEIRYRLLEKRSPLNFYLISNEEIDEFVDKHFHSQFAMEELCRELDLGNPGMESNSRNIIEAYLLSTAGIKILDLEKEELSTEVKERFGALDEKTPVEVKTMLFDENSGCCGAERLNVEIIRRKLFRLIHSRSGEFSIKNISIKDILSGKKISLSSLLDKLDLYSRPYLVMGTTGLGSIEHYNVITNFRINTSFNNENGGTQDDLPSRLNSSGSDEPEFPEIIAGVFELPAQYRPGEIVSAGTITGCPLFRINSIAGCAESYHQLIQNRACPLHIFNSPVFDAKYFPDPFRHANYLNPVKLWSGLLLLKILEERDGVYRFEDILSDSLRDIEARENYKRAVLDLADRINLSGGFDRINSGLLAEAVNTLGMLSKNPSDGMLQFRREYSYAITDLLENSGTGEGASAGEVAADKERGKNLKTPKFAVAGELVSFFENETVVREFVINSVKTVIASTEANIRGGADIALPKWKADQSEPPSFKDRLEFYDYFEKRGSLEWQNILRERLTDKLNEYIASSRFMLESEPSRIDRAKAGEFLRSLDQRMPDVVLWEVMVRNGIIK